jgi:hypothetical protein
MARNRSEPLVTERLLAAKTTTMMMRTHTTQPRPKVAPAQSIRAKTAQKGNINENDWARFPLRHSSKTQCWGDKYLTERM